jgi:TrpR family trp operon transcriptional repressor
MSELVGLLEKAAREPGVLKKVLADILTPAELNEVIARWQIVKHLTKGESHRSVAMDLHIGVATVARGAQALAKTSGGFPWLLKTSRLRK